MQYRSTRGDTSPRSFSDILLAGLADDGGLYMPETWPRFSAEQWREMRTLSYPDLAARILSVFTAGCIDLPTLQTLCARAYAGFSHAAIAPLTEIENGLFSMELFHGPTLAFKDMAMQLLGQLFEHVLTERNQRVTIVGATSGDTGSAAIEAFRGSPHLSVAILHPMGRTSEVQRRQMTTVQDANILNIAVEGTFDDCQDLVKAMFADTGFRKAVNLSAVNSINWARIAAQIPYYVRAALMLGAPDREVSFAVPTGNFGNVLAAWAAGEMGLPVRRLAIGSNRNDILTRFLTENDMSMRAVAPSLSPSMDIQVSSNFERLLFELLDRDPQACRDTMLAFRQNGRMRVDDAVWRRATARFDALMLDDDATLAEMKTLFERSGYLADPHTAIGIAAGRKAQEPGIPMVVAATAHPAKFPEAVCKATGIDPTLPPHLAGLFDREERYDILPNALTLVEDAVRRHVGLA
ncbi:threonine synthase [Swaminathania salitolerans]|uniref:Threonine synthase n=1 Tax=Swaminathania salitolerans TaxID=182838 RepID=A0A511BMD1_9PROT|nr:threonine synthase [Swaminathania salitolerans]GBQ15803.1 threonine synthase [Swaminathania salitolerans LMG 21291]GEL01491.1 threonine synthase [Swaminathania salitolerans]